MAEIGTRIGLNSQALLSIISIHLLNKPLSPETSHSTFLASLSLTVHDSVKMLALMETLCAFLSEPMETIKHLLYFFWLPISFVLLLSSFLHI